MKFVDYVTITVRSGRGGPGSVAFRREKFEPRGGPSGGDGGEGGSVLFEADDNLYTLLDLRYNRHHFARSGEPGQGANRKGKDGDDVVLRVPPGTLVRDTDTGELIGELNVAGDRLIVAKGGRGGKGNAFFKSATNQTPRHAQSGEPGVERNVTLELRLLADVGLVGFPNAGKSTLVSVLSAARPKIADYPFTTLEPALGVVSVGDYQSFVMADIPGIIEGAHTGKGLGLQFLKHVERNAVLLFVIPVTSKDLAGEYETLIGELGSYERKLLEKPRLIALSKTDILPPEEREMLPQVIGEDFPPGVDIYPISSVAGFGLDRLRHRLWEEVKKERSSETVES